MLRALIKGTSMQTLEQVARFTITLPVSDVSRSMRFYRILLERGAVSHDSSSAIFEVDNPPLRLRLVSGNRPGGTVNHLGLRLPDSPSLVAVQRRLEENGFATQRQDGVECCYARQTKFWITDPDGHLIEIYTLEEDIEHSGFEDAPGPKGIAANRPQVVWQHRLFDPVPTRIAAEDGSVDVVELEGTFNADLSAEAIGHLLAEAARVLKPGGHLVVNAMISDVPPAAVPKLPGMAAAVQRIRTRDETVAAVRAAGFASLHYDTLDDIVCFSIPGVRLFHLRLLAFRNGPDSARDHALLYKGPAARVRDDDGTWFSRGEIVAVSESAWQRLRNSPAAPQFLFLPAPRP
jgi:catechol 2,3-dioxygenase-like lactoylglutathione lyase family enzyme